MQGSDILDAIFQRAIKRGEIDASRLTERLVALPVDLVRQETFQTRQCVPDKVILEIIDTIFLPLVRPGRT